MSEASARGQPAVAEMSLVHFALISSQVSYAAWLKEVITSLPTPRTNRLKELMPGREEQR
jgi:hypothetical protein